MSSIANFDQETYQFNKVTLERTRKGMAVNLGHTSLESLEIRTMSDVFIGNVIEASFDVLRDKIHEDRTTVTFTYKVPSNWWEHLKKEKAPKWFKEKYPVQFTSKTMRRTAVFKRYSEYPKANVAIPKDSKLFIETLGGLEVIHDQVEQL